MFPFPLDKHLGVGLLCIWEVYDQLYKKLLEFSKGVVWVKWVYEHSSCATSSPTFGRVNIFYFSHSSVSLWWWDCACRGYSDKQCHHPMEAMWEEGTLLQWLAEQLKVKSYWKQTLKLMKTVPLPLPSQGTNPCFRASRMWWLFKNWW